MKKGKCKLCHKVTNLQRQSHIIPDFMYKQLYEGSSDHSISRLFIDHNNKTLRTGKASTGEYDKYILCENCDNGVINNKYEDYCAKALYGKPNETDVMTSDPLYDNGLKYHHIINLNYTKFKLFLISILWRSDISERQFFSQIKLGKYRDILRDMILSENPGQIYDFPCVMFSIKSAVPELMNQTITKPTKFKKNNISGYIYFISRIFYIFLVGENLYKKIDFVPNYIKDNIINQNNEMKLFELNKEEFDKIIKTSLNIF